MTSLINQSNCGWGNSVRIFKLILAFIQGGPFIEKSTNPQKNVQLYNMRIVCKKYLSCFKKSKCNTPSNLFLFLYEFLVKITQLFSLTVTEIGGILWCSEIIFLENVLQCIFTAFFQCHVIHLCKVPVCGDFYNFKVFCFKCFFVFTFIGPFQPSYDMMLTFYSYFKQATEGKCTRPKPWAWDIVNKKKWFATL